MKIKSFLIIAIVLICFSNISCTEKENKKPSDKGDFVYIEGGKFKLKGEFFFPLGLNYVVMLRGEGDSLFPAPTHDYHMFLKDNHVERDSILKILRSDFCMIKDMGFNSLRIVGIGEQLQHLPDSLTDSYINALETMVKIASDYKLYIVLLLPLRPEKESIWEKYVPVLEKFKDNPYLFAYDFFNEPVYFDIKYERTKSEVIGITNKWRTLMKKHAPNQLCTIGLTGSREINKWDPNLLNVDFLSFHPYEHAQNKVMRELYWYSQKVHKPWIIGETSLSADNDSVSYKTQKDFAEKILQLSINSGAAGFTWWQYKDVDWKSYFPNYMGVLYDGGRTQTSDPDLQVYGSQKDVVEVFKNFKYKKTGGPVKPDNYYNSFNFKDYKVIGRLIDAKTELPLENAMITGWDLGWSKAYITYTKKDGTFELWGPFEFYHYAVVDTRYTKIRGDIFWKKTFKMNNGVPCVDLKTIKLMPEGESD